MFREFNKYLGEFTEEVPVDYWFDEGCVIAQDMLAKFNDNDWQTLYSELLHKPLEWKKKLVYCFDDCDNLHEFRVILALINTDDEELFESCVDSLRNSNISDLKRELANNSNILKKIDAMLPRCGSATKRMLEDFKSRIQ